MVDISSVYMQSGHIKRTIYVRPPREWDGGTRRYKDRLLKVPYGITEAGRNLSLVIESCLMDVKGIDTIEYVSHIFIK